LGNQPGGRKGQMPGGKLESLGGIAGIRVNDRVDVRVSGFAVVGEAM